MVLGGVLLALAILPTVRAPQATARIGVNRVVVLAAGGVNHWLLNRRPKFVVAALAVVPDLWRVAGGRLAHADPPPAKSVSVFDGVLTASAPSARARSTD